MAGRKPSLDRTRGIAGAKALLSVVAGAVALANVASSPVLQPAQQAAVEASLRRELSPLRLARTTSLMVAPGSPDTVCGLAGLYGRAGRIDDIPFIGRLDGATFRVGLIGQTRRNDFTVRNMCAAEDLWFE